MLEGFEFESRPCSSPTDLKITSKWVGLPCNHVNCHESFKTVNALFIETRRWHSNIEQIMEMTFTHRDGFIVSWGYSTQKLNDDQENQSVKRFCWQSSVEATVSKVGRGYRSWSRGVVKDLFWRKQKGHYCDDTTEDNDKEAVSYKGKLMTTSSLTVLSNRAVRLPY